MNDDEVEKYLLISKSKRFNNLVSKTHEIIGEALNVSRYFYLSYSSGKDSTVLIDLLSHHRWSKTAFHAVASKYEDPQENIDLSIKASDKYGVDIQIHQCFGEYDAWKEAGYFFVDPFTKGERLLASKANEDFKKVALSFGENTNLPHRFMGITKSESKGREINIALRGWNYRLKNGNLVSNPLANWKNEDIWAYIVSRELEYLSVYDKQLYQPRELIRNEFTIMYSGVSQTKEMMIKYRYSYPKLFFELSKEFPEIRNYI